MIVLVLFLRKHVAVDVGLPGDDQNDEPNLPPFAVREPFDPVSFGLGSGKPFFLPCGARADVFKRDGKKATRGSK